jgi:hypothetical protein
MTALKPEDDFDPRAGDQAVCIYAPYQMALFFGDRYIGKRCRLLTDFSVQPEDRSDGVALCKIRFEDGREFWASREMLEPVPDGA